MTDTRDIEVEIDDPVCLIRLNRPEKLNALTHPMLRELRTAVDEAARDPRVVAILITGNGRGFCSGLDAQVLSATVGSTSEAPTVPDDELPGMFSYLLRTPKPVIAAINGVAAGGGYVLAAMSDVRIASDQASLTTIFMKRGLVAEHGTSWIMPRILGPSRALDLMLTSRRVQADEALTLGLVEYVVPHDELVDRAKAYVREIAASAAPASIALTKQMVYEHLGMGFADALRDGDVKQWIAVGSPDAVEGAAALVERRAPRFRRLGQE